MSWTSKELFWGTLGHENDRIVRVWSYGGFIVLKMVFVNWSLSICSVKSSDAVQQAQNEVGRC